MGTSVIVAIPSVDDRVWKVSSEKIPHLTIAYLSDVDEESMLYVQHAASQLSPFGLTVDHRGTLGDKNADVLFFEKNYWDIERVASFRHWLLQHRGIREAYDEVTQFPEWTPHLTLGYPETPAKENDQDFGLHYISFDRIAVWGDNYEGPEFRLKYSDYGQDTAMAMSTTQVGEKAVGELFHHGVKGMKWGVRKDVATSRGGADKGPTAVVVTQKKPGTFAKTEGGKGHPLHEDAQKALEARQKAKASTTDALSNKELQAAVQRMQLEQQYSQLAFHSDRRSKGMRFIAGLLGSKRYGQKDKRKFTDFNEQQGEQVRKTASKVKQALSDAGKGATTAPSFE